MRDCPQCNAPVDGEQCLSCGYRETRGKSSSRVIDPDHLRCDQTEAGLRCGNPGVWSPGTIGSGPWFCRQHSSTGQPDLSKRPMPPINAFRQALAGRQPGEDDE